MMKRNDVYRLLDGERDYQIERHKQHVFPHDDENHSVADWLVYMDEHLTRAKQAVYMLNFNEAMAQVRKATALGVACMEFKDTPPRDGSL